MPTAIIPHIVLLLKDFLSGAQAQRAIRINTSGHKYPSVHLPEVGVVPAVVAFRLELVKIDGHKQFWLPSATPYARNLLQRMFGDAVGDDTPMLGELKLLLKAVGVLEPPIGTVIQATFAFEKDGEAHWNWYVSTTEMASRRRQTALHHNELKVARAPIGTRWFVAWRKIGFVSLPDEPGTDQWVAEHNHEVEESVRLHLLAVIQSLWKAVFANEDHARASLRVAGYDMDGIGRTHMGVEDLHQVVQAAYDDRLRNITKCG